jgi:hypothetical protein
VSIIYRNTRYSKLKQMIVLWLPVLNATFNNISVILWRSALLVEEAWIPKENHRSVVNHNKLYHIMWCRVWMVFELTTLVVIRTDCTIEKAYTKNVKISYGYRCLRENNLNFNKYKILSQCLMKTGIKARFTETFPSFSPNTNKHYILRHCINIVFLQQ